MSILVSLSGLPGVGKTTLAKRLAARTRAIHLRVDSVEAALKRSALSIHPAEDAGYLAIASIAKDNLLLGFDVIADTVNPIEISRKLWVKTASDGGAHLMNVEVICSDKVSRTRQHLAKEGRRTTVALNFQEALLKEFQRAIETGETDGFAKLLSKSAQLHADGGGKATAIKHVLIGAVKIQSFVQDVLHVAWRGMEFHLSVINGDPGLVLLREGEVFGCVTCATKEDTQVSRIFIVRNPDKLTRLGRQIKVGPGNGSLTTEEKTV